MDDQDLARQPSAFLVGATRALLEIAVDFKVNGNLDAQTLGAIRGRVDNAVEPLSKEVSGSPAHAFEGGMRYGIDAAIGDIEPSPKPN